MFGSKTDLKIRVLNLGYSMPPKLEAQTDLFSAFLTTSQHNVDFKFFLHFQALVFTEQPFELSNITQWARTIIATNITQISHMK